MFSPLSSLLPLAEAFPAEEAARDRALTSLVRRLANAASLPPEVAALTLHLARSDLLDLYSGFVLGAFASVLTRFRPRRFPTVAQARLHDRLRTLLTLTPARTEALSWLGVALQDELTALLHGSLSQTRPISRRLAAGVLGVVNLLPTESDHPPEYEFALALLRLLLESADFTLPDLECTTLLAAVDGWVSAFPYFPEGRLRDLFLALHGLELTPPQRQALLERLLAWRDWSAIHRTVSSRTAAPTCVRCAAPWAGAARWLTWPNGPGASSTPVPSTPNCPTKKPPAAISPCACPRSSPAWPCSPARTKAPSPRSSKPSPNYCFSICSLCNWAAAWNASGCCSTCCPRPWRIPAGWNGWRRRSKHSASTA
ncbi:hypothetical protein Cagg_0689 [Chloroflexus aggregans DSM 9485]|uniref:Uncharacterized protein n=2 Tax=Chloroflexus aggregans TaxID=152260 RepID=B8G4Y6_CHLAD|nr:hypothetical protein Cagg_0689 [Chloroflexus aggregans DSM 9485]